MSIMLLAAQFCETIEDVKWLQVHADLFGVFGEKMENYTPSRKVNLINF